MLHVMFLNTVFFNIELKCCLKYFGKRFLEIHFNILTVLFFCQDRTKTISCVVKHYLNYYLQMSIGQGGPI